MAKSGQSVSLAKRLRSKVTKPKWFAIGLCVGIVASVAFGVAWKMNAGSEQVAPAPENNELSPAVVFSRVQEQNELVCASQDYAITDKFSNTNKIPFTDIDIPFTTNSCWYRYCGTIKIAVSLENAEFSQDGSTLRVVLDQPYISSNTPDMDKTGVLEENGNFLNPAHFNQVEEFQRACVEKSTEEVKNGTVFRDARENAQKNLQAIFTGAFGDQYQLEVTFRGEDAE